MVMGEVDVGFEFAIVNVVVVAGQPSDGELLVSMLLSVLKGFKELGSILIRRDLICCGH